MTSSNTEVDKKDEAKELSELFKKQGHLDKLKNDILSSQVSLRGKESEHATFEDSIKQIVSNLVKEMVEKDENLVFKNRGTTSALIETQVFKENYRKMNDNKDGINIDEFINKVHEDSKMIDDIKDKLRNLVPEQKEEESLNS